MKIYSYYLPQFHEIPENDDWWGKGFTEWTNVKRGMPLYKNHYQPKKPLNDNYYNLLDKSTLIQQSNLIQHYGVDALAFYHYWFLGDMLLEKPAENLMKWKEIKMPFFFFWANHNWHRSWNGSKEMLKEQKYGNEEEWEKHFQYCLKFFLDKRYEKIENKPVFGFFKSLDIPRIDDMMRYWNSRALDYGFAGIYFMQSIDTTKFNYQNSNCDMNVLREPSIAVSSYDRKHKIQNYGFKILNKIKNKIGFESSVRRYYYDDIVKESLKCANEYLSDKATALGCFTSWDNTCRHGKKGYVIEGSSPEKFEKYLYEMIKIAENRNCKIVIINAWNEWAEGMYLEPDNQYKYGYLKAISNCRSCFKI